MNTIYDPAKDPIEWINVDDPVMGGRSRSQTHVRERVKRGPALVFEGAVSLENNGGFCSTRTEGHEWHLEGLDAFEFEARADGKRYKFTVRTDQHHEGSYRYDFETKRDAIATHVFAIEDFEMYRRGSHLADAPPLDPSTIRSIGVLISDKQAGEFALEIFEIRSRFETD